MRDPIAIVGVGGIFPDAADVHEFWQNIHAARDSVRDVPDGRWILNREQVFSPNGVQPDKVYSSRACFIQDFELDRTGLPGGGQWLNALDPVHHYVIHAGLAAFREARLENVDRKRIGVIIGNIALPTETSSAQALQVLGSTFAQRAPGFSVTGADETGLAVNRYVTGVPAGILAKVLCLGGGTWTLDAACASSLYALKFAVEELESGRVDAVLSGGVSRADSLYTQMGFSQLHALSASGRCAPFDASGDGLVVGEGAGIVVLKRLDDALTHGDHIYGVIRGVGLSNDVDGNLLAPDSEGQLRALRPAYEQAGWNPWDIDLVECHATGTPLGDRTEFESLWEMWRDAPSGHRKCVLGSVKSNVGHLLTGAGAAGLIKVLMALRHKTLPPTANFSAPGPNLRMNESPFEVLGSSRPWEERGKGITRKAAVNGFGFGGINAHVLVEEWKPKAKSTSISFSRTTRPATCAPIAVVGMDASFGPWKTLRAFQERVLGGDSHAAPRLGRKWWGAHENPQLKGNTSRAADFHGFFVDEIKIPLGRYRIPPKELADMLPQQLLMLQVAAAALGDADYSDTDGLRTGLFTGIGLDLCTTNFHFRWSLLRDAEAYVREHDIRLSPDEFAAWVKQLRDAAGPPLTADRTMGALGGIVASRIAREFRIGGPSFTISSEESSGLRALMVAIRCLQAEEIDQALVGAVDLAGDIRSLWFTHADRPYAPDGVTRPFSASSGGALPGEGAAAVVLKRLDDAVRDGDRVYAVIRGVGAASGGEVDKVIPSASAYIQALHRAYEDAGVDPGLVQYIEAHGSGHRDEDALEASALTEFFSGSPANRTRFIGSVKADIGHPGAASGLASFIKTCLCLYQEILPPIRNLDSLVSPLDSSVFAAPPTAQYWLRNRAEGGRLAGVSSFSMDGSCAHVVLEGYEDAHEPQSDIARLQPLGARTEALFVISGRDSGHLTAQLGRLQKTVPRDGAFSIEYWARHWWGENRQDPKEALALSLIARDTRELHELIVDAEGRIQNGEPPGDQNERIFFRSKPIGPAGEIAFVYPGFGNHFHGMGREFSTAWPEIFRAQDKANAFLSDQFAPAFFWHGRNGRDMIPDEKAMIVGQVFLGTAISDVVRHLGVTPHAVIGYSLGESAGLVSLGAWSDRDEMLKRMQASTLFSHDLVGECRSVRASWNIPEPVEVSWVTGVINRSVADVRRALESESRVYLLIINTPEECVIGGEEKQVENVVRQLGCHFHPIYGAPTVHCEVAKAVADQYREFHSLKTAVPKNIRFYSMAWEKPYKISSRRVSDSIQAQALNQVDFPAVIQNAYADGVRYFLEIGPGVSCTRMISGILKDQPHVARSICCQGQNGVGAILRVLGHLIAEGVAIDLSNLYGMPTRVSQHLPEMHSASEQTIVVPTDGPPFDVPPLPAGAPSPPEKIEVAPPPSPTDEGAVTTETRYGPLIEQIRDGNSYRADAHTTYLRFASRLTATMTQNLKYQMNLLNTMAAAGIAPAVAARLQQRGLADDMPVIRREAEPSGAVESRYERRMENSGGMPPVAPPAPVHPTALNREQCLEFGIGSIASVLGEEFAEVDKHPTRVRLPDEPLMLVDRILQIDGEPRSMTSGRVVTEHDILPDAWYLDNGRIPTCIAVEAGQADLFLSGYLGIDFITRGLAVYRLLDAEIVFHGPLPQAGQVIRYDIRIDHFFKQSETYLFRFNFEGTVDGQPLLTMENGCAGFFTQEALDAGRGIVHTELQTRPMPGVRPADWVELVPMEIESYDDEQLEALRQGNLAGCFGAAFEGLPLTKPLTIPSGRMTLVHRILHLDPAGGRFGLGIIRGQADIHPDDWFLTCHFVDDQVMPGTLMYECCMHTFRVFLLRMGWIGEVDEVVYEPVPGTRSRLKCRGQVIESTRTADYEITIKELGYGPEPYAIADALMYADGRKVVEMNDMSVRLSGLSLERIQSIWGGRGRKKTASPAPKPAIFDRDRILAFAVGKPSEAFGEPYRIFDSDRIIARLPGPPYQFLDRVTEIQAEPWKMVAGGRIEAQYDVPPDEWYFASNRFGMPFSVLLEIALQPCGWLAAYVGSALTSDVDLSFRNLGGEATQFAPVGPNIGTLAIRVGLTAVSTSGGMVIQHYDLAVVAGQEPIYSGKTYFGFFTKAALADQVGVRGYAPWIEPKLATGRAFPYPEEKPFPDAMLRMIDRISAFVPDGGPAGLGFIRGHKRVDPDEWFFKAHFYQDPVCPGSLGLESFLQLLKVWAVERWGAGPDARFQTVAVNEKHVWTYRGQVIPTDEEVTVEAVITKVDDTRKLLWADGFLGVDGRIIYQMADFTLQFLDPA